ncbi:MAG: hypothetical protein MJY90_07815 [Bacteroidaceae bacterium]|nr:hypothetical protein [Bacteroidaceae bacterium]
MNKQVKVREKLQVKEEWLDVMVANGHEEWSVGIPHIIVTSKYMSHFAWMCQPYDMVSAGVVRHKTMVSWHEMMVLQHEMMVSCHDTTGFIQFVPFPEIVRQFF